MTSPCACGLCLVAPTFVPPGKAPLGPVGDSDILAQHPLALARVRTVPVEIALDIGHGSGVVEQSGVMLADGVEAAVADDEAVDEGQVGEAAGLDEFLGQDDIRS